jgi:hypothetical protein
MNKICKKCNIEKSIEEFNYHNDNKDHLTGKCKKCLQEDRKHRELKRFNPCLNGSKKCCRCQKEKPKNDFILNKSSSDGFNGWCRRCSKDATLLRKYKISLDEYNQLLKQQGFTCKICGTNDPAGPQNIFVVDHDHKTGKVRGLLCNHCNTAIGKLHDDPKLLRKAAIYIEAQGNY